MRDPLFAIRYPFRKYGYFGEKACINIYFLKSAHSILLRNLRGKVSDRIKNKDFEEILKYYFPQLLLKPSEERLVKSQQAPFGQFLHWAPNQGRNHSPALVPIILFI